jgi:predicted nucleic acid-binding protein
VIVADTSIWVEFFRNREPAHARLNELLERGMVLASEGVFAELLSGARAQQEVDLVESFWKSLPKVNEAGIWIEAGKLSAARGLRARGVGLVDSAILALAARTGSQIWTLDSRLQEAAGKSAFR